MDPLLKQLLENAFFAASKRNTETPSKTQRSFDAWFEQNEEMFDKIKCYRAIDLKNEPVSCIIKLDKDFHIYIHGNKEKLTTGEDADGNFVKIRYDVAHW